VDRSRISDACALHARSSTSSRFSRRPIRPISTATRWPGPTRGAPAANAQHEHVARRERHELGDVREEARDVSHHARCRGRMNDFAVDVNADIKIVRRFNALAWRDIGTDDARAIPRLEAHGRTVEAFGRHTVIGYDRVARDIGQRVAFRKRGKPCARSRCPR